MSLQRLNWAAIMAPFFAVALFSQASTAATRWPNEEVRVGAGHPALVHFIKGAPDKPLVIFIPGSLFTARIAYGHPGSNEKDFLAYWLHSEGYSFLAASYPIDTATPITNSVDPAFTIREWGEQVAEIAKQYVNENKLNGRIIVLGWSMGGKIAESINVAALKNDLKIDFYTSLSATPPMPGLVDFEDYRPLGTGLADRRASIPEWYGFVQHQQELNGHVIIPRSVFFSDYVGNIPINIQGLPLRYNGPNAPFRNDLLEGIRDMGSFDFRDYPLAAIILDDDASDATHVLSDMGWWGYITTNKIVFDYLKATNLSDLSGLPPAKWSKLVAIVRGAPQRLSASVHGGHAFFLGELGARQTALDVETLEISVAKLKSELTGLLGRPVQ